jgi:quinoprotein glucose dehydrogenase
MKILLSPIASALLLSLSGPLFAAPVPQAAIASTAPANQSWTSSGGAPGNGHYSPLAQINRSNVADLAVAWSFDTHESGGLQSSPIIIDGVLYGVTPSQKVFALDAATGKLLWKFDSGVAGTQPVRGLAFWSLEGSAANSASNTGAEQKRVLVGVMYFLYALEAATGKPIRSFGQQGRIDLREGLGRPLADSWVSLTSPGVIYKDVIIVGGRNAETLPAPPGDVRAFDVRTGKMRWAFHTIPHPGEFGYETWPKEAWKSSGAANNWAGMAVDPERGVVYVPTGSAAFDFYGGDRLGDDLFANTLIALNADTGERIWHFQAVRHDIWDRDFPSAPALLTLHRDGHSIDAIAQTTKQGFPWNIGNIRPAPSQVKLPRPSSHYQRSLHPTRVNSSPKTCSASARPKCTKTPSSVSTPRAAKANFCHSAWLPIRSFFRASTAARNGGALQSILKPPFSM